MRLALLVGPPTEERTIPSEKPLVLITGASGNIGRSIASELADEYEIVGLDREAGDEPFPTLAFDLASDEAVQAAFDKLAQHFGRSLAAVIHLAAFFDATGKDNPLYRIVNVEGTRRLLGALQAFEVDRFIYASTMLVHRPVEPGERIDEDSALEPPYVYPASKLATEEVIHQHRGGIPSAILRLAGVYDRETAVPTLAHQIARIYERQFESHLYSGSRLTGQSMLHRDDMVRAFALTVAARDRLPDEAVMLIGEPDAPGYDALQDEIGELIHGRETWTTLRVPKTLAAAGAWAQAKLEPVIPDALDQGERPFIRPYMVEMADAHYALSVRRAREWIDWEPEHRLRDELPAMIAHLKEDPARWYRDNGVTSPVWLDEASAREADGEALRRDAETRVRSEHAQHRWAHMVNIGLGFWLLTQPPLIGVTEPWLRWAEFSLGAALVAFAMLALGWQMTFARWACAAIGAAVMAAPFVFWTTNAAAYLSDTLVGALIFGFAVCTKPEPGTALVARVTGPEVPPGWNFNPSSWVQRIPIIVLAVVGLLVSRYLAAYQLEHVDGVWEPFFAGSPTDPQNGTEEIITSSVSQAWPVPDAALGAYTYALEILTGIVGSRTRWRTMPWLVLLFGLMIVPLGIVSITFIIIQPIVIGTWSTLALIAAAAMLIQIPYSLDELLAVAQFMKRRIKAGKPWLRVFLFGDTDDEQPARADTPSRPAPACREHRTQADGKAGDAAASGYTPGAFDRPAHVVLFDMVSGGVNLPWNLALAALIAIALMFSRLTVGAADGIANADHLLGSLSLTVIALACAEPARILRLLLIPLGFGLCIVPFVYETSTLHLALDVAFGLALIALSLRRGRITQRYGEWQRFLV
ncbi:MAG: NAD-dependent epimerase/dehydratase family protein [Burkholderiaceae bacterium]